MVAVYLRRAFSNAANYHPAQCHEEDDEGYDDDVMMRGDGIIVTSSSSYQNNGNNNNHNNNNNNANETPGFHQPSPRCARESNITTTEELGRSVKWLLMGVAVIILSSIASVVYTHRNNDSNIIGSIIQGNVLAEGTKNDGTSSAASSNENACLDGADPKLSKLKASASIEGLEHGAVASDHPLCSKVGTSVLRDRGGNAVDAAVAVALCLGIANPASSGIGGGAFLLVHADPADETNGSSSSNGSGSNKNSKILFHDDRTTGSGAPVPKSKSGKITEVIDCREVAPGAATANMYDGASATGQEEEEDYDYDYEEDPSIFGGMAVAVPGELRGLELAHARHGKLPWSSVLEPIVEMARNGVAVNANLANEIKWNLPGMKHRHSTAFRSFLAKNNRWKEPLEEGDILRIPNLAETLEDVMRRGADALYTGARADQLAEDVQKAGGILTREDLESYRPTLRSPVVAHDVHGFSLVGVPPPSSGGAAVIGAARFLSGFDTPFATFADTLSTHWLVEAFKHVFAIRMCLSDPSYNTGTVKSAVKDLVMGSYIDSLRRLTKRNQTLPLSMYGGVKWAKLQDEEGAAVNVTDGKEGDRQRQRRRKRRKLLRRFGYLNDHGTSHFSIVDKDGNSVAMTTTVNLYFGSQVFSESNGIILNNQMNDFAYPSESANAFGLKPSKENYIQPGKKPLSSMSPTMLFRNSEDVTSSVNSNDEEVVLGDLTLVLGASGGPKIITAVLQVLLNYIILGQPLFEAMVHPRIHNQLIYNGAAATGLENSWVDNGSNDVTNIAVSLRSRQALQKRGHRLLDIDYAGTVQAVAIDLETNRISAVSDIRKGGSPAGY